MTEDLQHYGTPRHSGRYPWGSGDNSQQSQRSFLGQIAYLKSEGMSEADIAKTLGLSSASELKSLYSIARNEQKKADQAQAFRLKEKGYSNVAIGERMGVNESTVRSWLNPSTVDRTNILSVATSALKSEVDSKKYIDIGSGAEYDLDISESRLRTAVTKLKAEGYKVYYLKIPQLGTGHETTVKVLVAPDVTYSELYKNRSEIKTISSYSEDGGRTLLGIKPPASISSSRVAVRYAEEGGKDADGTIYIRPGVDDLSLGNKRYAQVRIAVDGTHYLKGMAMYRDDLPDGVDIVFNTNKSKTANKLDAMKDLKSDTDNPFGAVIRRQRHFIDADGKEQLSPINIVNEEGDWGEWSKTLSSQMLSKQRPALARQQLDLAYQQRATELETINSLTNPAVKKRLLMPFADEADSAAVHLKAAHLPRQASHVILPINSLADNEIYAPNYRPGESVVLIRYPHGGTFEIPELRVNNRNQEARRILGSVPDAVGINAKVAQRLSGADFDGDTVLVIPNNSGAIKTSSPLKGLKDFDPQASYPAYDGMRTIDGGKFNASTGKVDFPPGKKPNSQTKQTEMGKVSNLITDMTIRGATHDEIARAVRHSMVVIDSEKHALNYKESERVNGILDLKKKYQGSPTGESKGLGAKTLISRSAAEIRVPERKPRPVSEGGPIDPVTGEKKYVPTNNTYVDSKGRTKPKMELSTRMAEARDAYELSSGTVMESIYADHANRMKALANRARKEALATPNLPYSAAAAERYKNEVASLSAKLNIAKKNRPRERQAQILANAVVSAKRAENPSLEASDIKKISAQALTEMRNRVGAKKTPISITPSEWDAIQSGALRPTRLLDVLTETDLDLVKRLATPREPTVLTSAVMARAKTMLASGYSQAEVADALGIATSTLNSGLREEG